MKEIELAHQEAIKTLKMVNSISVVKLSLSVFLCRSMTKN